MLPVCFFIKAQKNKKLLPSWVFGILCHSPILCLEQMNTKVPRPNAIPHPAAHSCPTPSPQGRLPAPPQGPRIVLGSPSGPPPAAPPVLLQHPGTPSVWSPGAASGSSPGIPWNLLKALAPPHPSAPSPGKCPPLAPLSALPWPLSVSSLSIPSGSSPVAPSGPPAPHQLRIDLAGSAYLFGSFD